jgi:hypothetical protein
VVLQHGQRGRPSHRKGIAAATATGFIGLTHYVVRCARRVILWNRAFRRIELGTILACTTTECRRAGWVAPPGRGLTQRPVVTPEGQAESADRAQDRQSASYLSARPYPQGHPRQ